MERPVHLLVISASEDWQKAVAKISSELGVVAKISEEEETAATSDLIFIDASSSPNIPNLLAKTRSRNPRAYIVVFAADPTWREARDVLLGGASDYMDKSLRRDEIRSAVLHILQQLHGGAGPQPSRNMLPENNAREDEHDR